VKDIYPGSSNSSIGYLANVNGTLFFVANDGVSGTELWKTDGTAAGTVMIKDIRNGSMGGNPSELVNVNGVLFFSADDGINGTELWKSDGTVSGTVRVKNINPNGGSSYPQSLANVNGVLFFAADDDAHGPELWKTDGTEAGTVMVKDIQPGNGGSYPFELTTVNSTLFFSANDGNSGAELWKTDGTSAGTVMIKDIWEGNNDGYPFGLVSAGGVLFFSADNGSNGVELWKTDGTASGTALVKDIWPGHESGAAGNFSRFVDKIIFKGNDGINGYRTWESDGTASGTNIATGLVNTGEDDITELTETGVKIFASIRQDGTGSELWALTSSTTLPLDLTEFNAMPVNGDVLLSWETENEFNTSMFSIERSMDGKQFISIGSKTASNVSGVNQYHFTDENIPFTGLIYYRLKQTDIDGKYSYSKIATVAVNEKVEFNIYPNPANDKIKLRVSKGNLCYGVYDNLGRLMFRNIVNVISANTILPINISSLPSGIYHIDIFWDGGKRSLSFIKK
jgi:trimeric autotransporter adhesin